MEQNQTEVSGANNSKLIQNSQPQSNQQQAQQTTLFDEMSLLQNVLMAEKELRQTFSQIFEDQINNKLTPLIKTHLQTQLKAKTDMDLFKYEVQKWKIEVEITTLEDKFIKSDSDLQMLGNESNPFIARLNRLVKALKSQKKPELITNLTQLSGSGMLVQQEEELQLESLKKRLESLVKPEERQLNCDAASKLTQSGKYAIEQLLWYLWDNQAIFSLFVDEFLIGQFNDAQRTKNTIKAKELLYLVSNNMFVDPTCQNSDWRVVEISQRFIAYEVKQANQIQDLYQSRLLNGWLKMLKKSSEARRCVQYLFKAKCQKIDLNYLGWHNMLKVYDRFRQSGRDSSFNGSFLSDESSNDGLRRTSADFSRDRRSDSDTSSQSGSNQDQRLRKKLQEQWRMLIRQILEIVECIMKSIFEKVSTIPYAIRQFCKCLYESVKQKFPKTSEVQMYQLIAHYLLENWLLKSIFTKLNMEGLVKEFFIPHNCKRNLHLASHIMLQTITLQEWEVDTPDSERLPGESSGKQQLFSMNPKLRQDLNKESIAFFRNLLQVDRDGVSSFSISQDVASVSDSTTKFQWHMMVLSMKQIRLLLQFFHSQSESQFKGIKVLLDRVEYHNENDQILEEPIQDFQDDRDAIPVTYYLIMKPPQIKEIKLPKMGGDRSKNELQDRDHLKQLLVESEIMQQYRPLIKDHNSVSQILVLLRQHIEKKKVFSTNGYQDFKYSFVLNSINSHFAKYQQQMRDHFKKFIQRAAYDQVHQNTQLKDILTVDLQSLKLQEKLLKERIEVWQTMADIVINLKKTKARSIFVLQTSFDVWMYKFEQPDYIELVEEGKKSAYSKNFDEYIDIQRERNRLAEERKKTNQLLQDKMKESGNGNLALNMLFKGSEMQDLIKIKQKQEVSMQQLSPTQRHSVLHTSNDQLTLSPTQQNRQTTLLQSLDNQRDNIDPRTIPGYYTSKSKKKIGNINDFINNVRKLNALPEFCKQNEKEYAGIKKFFNDFLFRIKQKLFEAPNLKNDVQQQMEEITDYIMKALHQEFFGNKMPSVDEYNLQAKIDQMKELEPITFGITEDMGAVNPEIKFAWKAAIKELQKIPEVYTPRQKLLQVGSAIEIIQHGASLFNGGTQINADDIVTVLPYLLVKAGVDRLLAHYNFIETFHYGTSEGDKIEVFKTNLAIAMERLKQFILPGSAQAEESKLEAMGDEFEMVLEKSPGEQKQQAQPRTDSLLSTNTTDSQFPQFPQESRQ